MALDYSAGCVNFRDVGDALALVADTDIFPTRRLFRGGKIDFVTDTAAIETPATILNLRRGDESTESSRCLRTHPSIERS